MTTTTVWLSNPTVAQASYRFAYNAADLRSARVTVSRGPFDLYFHELRGGFGALRTVIHQENAKGEVSLRLVRAASGELLPDDEQRAVAAAMREALSTLKPSPTAKAPVLLADALSYILDRLAP